MARWARYQSGRGYPYVGKAAGEEGLLAMHPPQDGHKAVVCAFEAPTEGTYTVADVGISLVDRRCSGPVTLRVFHVVLDEDRAGSDGLPTIRAATELLGCSPSVAERDAPSKTPPSRADRASVALRKGELLAFHVSAQGSGFSFGAETAQILAEEVQHLGDRVGRTELESLDLHTKAIRDFAEPIPGLPDLPRSQRRLRRRRRPRRRWRQRTATARRRAAFLTRAFRVRRRPRRAGVAQCACSTHGRCLRRCLRPTIRRRREPWTS